MKVSLRGQVPPFQVMAILDRVAELRAAGRDVISLCAGEPQGGAPADVRTLAADLYAGTDPLGYTGALGLPELRRAIADHYGRWYDLPVDAREVAVTTGASGAFVLVFLAAFDVGDRVAVVRPGYPAYRNVLRALAIDVVDVPAGADTGFEPTPALLDAVVAEHGPLHGLVLASPANPTGSMVDRTRLAALVDWCREHDVRLISDEIYHGITFPAAADPDPRGVTAVELDPNAIVINSFSKYWGMTGWRLGWALLPEDLVGPLEALASNFALSPPAPAQELAMTAFTAETYAERDLVVQGFARARQLILDAAPALNWGVAAPSDGAFYFYSELGPQLERFGSATAYAQALLEQADVALVPGVDFDPIAGDRAVRISYAAGEAAVREALARILAFQAR